MLRKAAEKLLGGGKARTETLDARAQKGSRAPHRGRRVVPDGRCSAPEEILEGV